MDNNEKEWYRRHLSKYPRIGGTIRNRKLNTYAQLAYEFKKLGGMSLSSIKRYEMGLSDCPASVLYALSLYYKCNIQELFDDDAYIGHEALNKADGFRFNEFTYKETSSGSSTSYPEKLQGYRLDYGLELSQRDYDLVTLSQDHQALNLPKGAKLLIRARLRRENWEKLLNNEERMYYMTLEIKSIETFPKKHQKDSQYVSFITKARVIGDADSGRTVIYQYDNKTKHITYQTFKRGITGFVDKIIIDFL
jgi:hypothetical protein